MLLLMVLVFAGPIAKWYVEKHDKELIGRELTIGKLWVNVFSGTAKIDDLTLYEDDGATPFVSFDHFDTNIKLRDLLDNRLWVNHATAWCSTSPPTSPRNLLSLPISA